MACVVGRDSSVGIVTYYGLDCPGIELRWRQDFRHPSTPVLGPTQPPIQWGYRVSFPGVKRPGRGVNHPPYLALRLKEEQSYVSSAPLGLHDLYLGDLYLFYLNGLYIARVTLEVGLL
jgi:hypothetical protein